VRNIYLVGFMGAGKSSVGRALADRLDRVFFDLDEAIEARLGMPIPEIFATLGEDAFRRAEAEEVEMTTDRAGLVVATGGGAFASAGNRRLIHGSGGVSVFLDPPWEVIRRRIDAESSSRPKWTDHDQARRLMTSRRPDYLRASIHLQLDGDEGPVQVAERIAGVLSELACAS
jgi:shikimate kinase